MPSIPIDKILTDNDWGRRFFTKDVLARAARAATTSGGHRSITPGGGLIILDTSGRTLLMARYDLAIGHWPFLNHLLVGNS